MINQFIRWWLKSKIDYLQRMSDNHWMTDADIRRDGNSAKYWLGKSQGIDAALKLLELKPLNEE